MSARDQSWWLWKGPSIVWLVLLVLLAGSFASAYWSLGVANTAINLATAAVMIGFLVTFLMDLRSSPALIHMVAVAGLFWITFMFTLTFADYLTRHY